MPNELVVTGQVNVTMSDEVLQQAYEIALKTNMSKLNRYLKPYSGRYTTSGDADNHRENILKNVDEVITLLLFYKQHEERIQRYKRGYY